VSHEFGTPDIRLCNLLDKHSEWVMSFNRLSREMRQIVIDCAHLCRVFNLGQFVQGENLPSAFSTLKRELEKSESDSKKLLRALLFTTLCTIGGLMGAVTIEGCKFLDEKRGRQVSMAIEAMGDLTGDPIELYWNHIASRGSMLGMTKIDSIETKTLARLACITRCAGREELDALQTDWCSLSIADRCFLCSRLVADGISEQGFVFENLPMFFGNVKSNPYLTLKDGFDMLIESIGTIEGIIIEAGDTLTGTAICDVMEMAKIAGAVRSCFKFLQSAEALCLSPQLKRGGTPAYSTFYHRVFWKAATSAEDEGDINHQHIELRRFRRNQRFERSLEESLAGSYHDVMV
jgi:hypothetical protein